jgi:hypothetical protein
LNAVFLEWWMVNGGWVDEAMKRLQNACR